MQIFDKNNPIEFNLQTGLNLETWIWSLPEMFSLEDSYVKLGFMESPKLNFENASGSSVSFWIYQDGNSGAVALSWSTYVKPCSSNSNGKRVRDVQSRQSVCSISESLAQNFLQAFRVLSYHRQCFVLLYRGKSIIVSVTAANLRYQKWISLSLTCVSRCLPAAVMSCSTFY